MTPEQEAGLTKARLICNASRAAEDRFGTNEAYAKWFQIVSIGIQGGVVAANLRFVF